ncbi:hypothetical protein LCGC14_0845360 [marine sediment metagenome]|uniref:Uncharacterized protein n=1 Tax=marine sediment metagenome TaxID=412755 RepID=A0A0F9RWM8_9ZZZZ
MKLHDASPYKNAYHAGNATRRLTKRLLLTIVIVVFVIGAGWLAATNIYEAYTDVIAGRTAYGYCLDSGYPEIITHDGLHYCVKSVDGTDMVVRLSKLFDG